MATRPKQRVLVRWNDDLDKSLLLFITHTCTELGIKIPYDEVARRMGSTFTEGAIQQHISKLRNKMAELNVAPVPAAPKRGAVTSKPSSVYGQKGRAGPAPQQPVASKTQARTTVPQSDGRTTTGPATKRSTRRKATGVKRSESDDGQTDDEFGGMSDDDFSAELNHSGKRGRGNGNQGRASKKVGNTRPGGLSDTAIIMRDLAEADARYEANLARDDTHGSPSQGLIFVQQSIEGNQGPHPTAPGTTSHFGQLMHAAEDHEEEEEEEEFARAVTTNSQLAVPIFNSAFFNSGQDEQLSPTSMSQMPTHVAPYLYNGSQTMANDYSGGLQQMSQPFPASRNSSFFSNSADLGLSNYQLSPQANIPSRQNYMTPHMLPAPYPSASMAGPSGVQTDGRNYSMGSSSSQNTFVNLPHTPATNVSSAHQSPSNEWARTDLNNLSSAQDPMANAWGFDANVGTPFQFESAVREDLSNGDAFARELFN